MKEFVIFNSDGEELTDLSVYPQTHFTIEKCFDWWKVACHFGSHKEFCGLFKSRDDAQRQIECCENDFKDAQRGLTKAEGFQFANTVTTEEMINFASELVKQAELHKLTARLILDVFTERRAVGGD